MADGFRPMQVERAVSEIRDKIHSREYPSGMRLVLRTLAGSLNMSIIPIRDALAQLEREGLVEGEAGRGWRVAEYNPAELLSLADLREALECHVARLCAVRATEEELEELDLLARQADRIADGDRRVVYRLEAKFHLGLAAVAKSDKLKRAIERAHVIQLTFAPTSSQAVRIDKAHVKLMRAIASRDPDVAEREMRAHCSSTAYAIGMEIGQKGGKGRHERAAGSR